MLAGTSMRTEDTRDAIPLEETKHGWFMTVCKIVIVVNVFPETDVGTQLVA